MTDISKVDDRLRAVEQAVTRIETRLDTFPTRESLWKSLAVAAGSIIASMLGVAIWMAQSYLGPIIEELAK